MSVGPINLLVVGRQDNGTAFASYWDNSTWHKPAAPLLQGKVFLNFTSVALFQSDEIKMFGVTNDSGIHSYIVDRKNPLSWTHDQTVRIS